MAFNPQNHVPVQMFSSLLLYPELEGTAIAKSPYGKELTEGEAAGPDEIGEQI